MSRVTNVILTFNEYHPHRMIEALNDAWPGHSVGFSLIESWDCAGDKHLEADIAVGAFNHMDLEAFKAAVKSVPWEDPEDVQLFVKEEEETRFHEVGLWERGE